jgi:ribosomal protein L20A (L18A)
MMTTKAPKEQKKQRLKPGPKPVTVCQAKRRRCIEKLLRKIAVKHTTKFPEVIISQFANVSVYAVRQWLTRGIARAHIPLVANLAGEEVDVVEKAHGL